MARFAAFSVQLDISCGCVTHAGTHINRPNRMNIAVSSHDAKRAERPESMATAARANAIVVVIAQNIRPGGIHFGTKLAV